MEEDEGRPYPRRGLKGIISKKNKCLARKQQLQCTLCARAPPSLSLLQLLISLHKIEQFVEFCINPRFFYYFNLDVLHIVNQLKTINFFFKLLLVAFNTFDNVSKISNRMNITS